MDQIGVGDKALFHIADSALVTPNRLQELREGQLLIMRLPSTYAESGRAVSEAIHASQGEELGQLSRTKATASRPAALYCAAKSTVTLYDKPYRAVVAHSSAHEKRRHQKIERELAKEQASSACPRITMPFCRVGGAHQSSRSAQPPLRSHQE